MILLQKFAIYLIKITVPYIVSFLVHPSRLLFIVLILLVIMGESSSMGYRLPDGVGVGTYLVEVLPRP